MSWATPTGRWGSRGRDAGCPYRLHGMSKKLPAGPRGQSQKAGTGAAGFEAGKARRPREGSDLTLRAAVGRGRSEMVGSLLEHSSC